MFSLPTPGYITKEANIPQELRDVPQWILWAPKLRGNNVTKEPRSYRDPSGNPIDVNDSSHWTTFDNAIAVMRADAGGLVGIGLVLNGTGLICLDYDDHEGDDAEAVARGAAYIAEELAKYPTYVETSISGKGQHWFYRATLPHGLTNGTMAPISITAYSRRFIALTGIIDEHKIDWGQVADGQQLVDSWTLPAPVNAVGALGATEALGRRLDLTDDEVGYTLRMRRPAEFKVLTSSLDMTPKRGEWWLRIIGDLDKITGDPAQIDRMISESPAYRNSFNAERYDQQEKWLGKQGCASMLEYWLKHARSSNEIAIAPVERITPERLEFLLKVGAAITWHTNNKNSPLPAEAVASVTSGKQPRFSATAMRAIEQLTIASGVEERYLTETAPPGPIGEFVECVAMGMYEPFLSFAIPATLSGLAGITARGLKLDDGQGTNIFNLLFAQTSTGKSQSVESFETFLADVRIRGGNGAPEGIANMPDYFRAIDLISRQGAHMPFQNAPSACWVEEECWRILDLIINPGKGSSAFSPSDFVNKLFDESKVTKVHMPPASVRAKRDGDTKIANLSQSLYWVTTASNASKVLGRDVIDTGAASRMIPLLHPGSAGVEHQDLSHRMQQLPTRMHDRLLQLVLRSMDLQVQYNVATATDKIMSPDISRLITVSKMNPDASALYEKNRKALGTFKRGIQDSILDYPSTYIMFSRISMLSQRIAAQIAYFNSDSAVIDHEALSWATGHLAQRIGTFLTAFDRGDMGEALEDGEKTILKAIRDLLRRGKGDSTGFVPYSDLSKMIRDRAPFSTLMKSRGATAVRGEIRSLLHEMVQEGMLALRSEPTNTNTGKFYAATSHKCWEDIK